MKASLMTKTGQKKGDIELPSQFGEPLRPDLVKRAFDQLAHSSRQTYGASPEAGKRASAEISRRRHNYRGSYGFGIGRVPRKIMSRRGTRMNWTGAFAPGTVGGRRAHAPKAEKCWQIKINKKERQFAIRAALSATVSKEAVSEHGHKIPQSFPVMISDDFQSISKCKDLRNALSAIGCDDELVRTTKKTIRAGRGTIRGRKYRRKTGPLLVVSDSCDLQKASKNIPGLSCVVVSNLNVRLLAPGGQHGRFTLFTESALKKLKEENLFTKDYKAPPQKKKQEPQPKKPVVKEKALPKKAAPKKEAPPTPAPKKPSVEEKPVKKEPAQKTVKQSE